MSRPAVLAVLLLAAPAAAQTEDPILSLYNQGRKELAAGKHAAALKSLTQAREMAEQKFPAGHANIALVVYELGEVYLDRAREATGSSDDLKKAAAVYEEAWDIRNKSLGKTHTSTINCVDRLGEVKTLQGEYAVAERLLAAALTARESALDPKHYLIDRSYQNLAHLYSESGRLVEAEKFHRKSLGWAEAHRGPASMAAASALDKLAVVQTRKGEPKAALENLDRAMAIAAALPGGESRSDYIPLGNRADALQALGRYADAEKLREKAIESAVRVLGPDHPGTAEVIRKLADAYSTAGRAKAAEVACRRALAIHETKLGPEHPLTAQTRGQLGLILLDLADYNAAEVALAASLKSGEAVLGKHHPTVGTMCNNLGLLYRTMDFHDRAEPLLRRAIAIREAAYGKDHQSLARALLNLADLEKERGRHAEADALYARAVAIIERSFGPNSLLLAVALNNYYRLKIEKDKTVRLDMLERALGIYVAQLGAGHPQAAEIRFNLGYGYYRALDYAKAEPPLRQSLTVLTKTLGPAHPNTLSAAKVLALTEYALGRREAAAERLDGVRRNTRAYVTGVLPGLSAADQRAFLKGTDPYALGQALTLALTDAGLADVPAATAGWLANGKAMLLETQAAAVQVANAGDSPAARGLRAVRQELAGMTLTGAADDARRESLLAKEKEFVAALRAAGERLDAARPWVELESVRQALPVNGVFVDVARFAPARLIPKVGEENFFPPRYVAWVTPKVGPVKVFDLGPAAEVDDAVAAARAAVTAAAKTVPDLGEPAAEAKAKAALLEVSKKVLHPLLPAAGAADHWVVSPDGALWLLPWAALPLPGGEYAVEKHTIRTVVSGRDVVPAERAKVTPTAPLVVADPDYDLDPAETAKEARALLGDRYRDAAGKTMGLGRFGRLAGTAAEAEAITPPFEAWAGGKARVLTDRQAVKAAVLAAKNPAAVVLSTHGFFLPEQDVEPQESAGTRSGQIRAKDGTAVADPLTRCGLVFAGANAASAAGVLTGLEVVGCDLRGTRLVVLSACETGLGEVRTGEGVAGLRQAFQLAGAEGVVASLWQVPDLPTAQLMIAFFTTLADAPDRAQALAAAQRQMLKQRRAKSGAAHPFFWAAFILTGLAQ